jgi:hypothetical protein
MDFDIRVRDYKTMALICIVKKSRFNAWCSDHGKLPHHSTNNGGIWYVV